LTVILVKFQARSQNCD